MSDEKRLQELQNIVLEQSIRNTAAIQVLIDVVTNRELITIDEFNEMAKSELERVKDATQKRVNNPNL